MSGHDPYRTAQATPFVDAEPPTPQELAKKVMDALSELDGCDQHVFLRMVAAGLGHLVVEYDAP